MRSWGWSLQGRFSALGKSIPDMFFVPTYPSSSCLPLPLLLSFLFPPSSSCEGTARKQLFIIWEEDLHQTLTVSASQFWTCYSPYLWEISICCLIHLVCCAEWTSTLPHPQSSHHPIKLWVYKNSFWGEILSVSFIFSLFMSTAFQLDER